jgi:hypothetical protein
LFYGIDHKLLYESCQEMMCQHRQGRLPDNIFFYDDHVKKQKMLPEPVLSLHPTYVRVLDIMTDIGFLDEGRTQSLRCDSNEFGNPISRDDNVKGLGFTKDPFDMEKLHGQESLDYLNGRYEHFEIELFPGLVYQVFKEEKLTNIAEVKESVRNSDILFTQMFKMMDIVAVKKQRLLYKTDHNELLKACREIMVKYKNGGFSAGKIDLVEERFSKDIKNIPEIIMNLEPVYIWFGENTVMVALMGGLDHSGVVAYDSVDEQTARKDDIKLLDGLFYYDDGLREGAQDYKDYLKDLRTESVTYLDWKRKQMNLPVPNKVK